MVSFARLPWFWVAFVLPLVIGTRALAAEPTRLSCAALAAPTDAPRPIASYQIAATLSATEHEVTGHSRIRWVNPSRFPTSELYIHAYMNAFSHPRTRFLRASDNSRSGSGQPADYGHLRITRLVAADRNNLDLLPALERHTRDDPDDATDLHLALPFEVGPAASLELEVEFVTKLPGLVERAGFSDSFHAVAQWFPKIARLDPSGVWHHYAYEPLAEFSSDFGDYDVTLEVPGAFVVAAPGQRIENDIVRGTRRERYCLNSVHDFAWFTWDRFVESTHRIGSVDVRQYAPPDQTENSRRSVEALRFGFEHYAAHFFAYPFQNLTVVHPPDSARAAGGMEYPQLITTGGPWYLPYLGWRAVEAVTLHELAHQWFYATVASDEVMEPVLDEGLTSWAETQALAARFGAGSMLNTAWFSISEGAARRELARTYTRRGPLAIRASDFGGFPALAGRVYARFPTLLETIALVHGHAALEQALRVYAIDYRFKHPNSTDFLGVMRDQLPTNASAAISTALLGDGWVDYAVREISSPFASATGLFNNRVLVERRGTLSFPAMLEVEFLDGKTARRLIDSIESTTWIEWQHRTPIVRATIDPDHLITIDDDLRNQTLRVNGVLPRARLATALHVAFSVIWALVWP